MTRVPLIAFTVMCLLAPLAAARQNAPPAPVRVGGNVAPPKKTRHVPPVYPPEAQQAHVQGLVIIEATIGEDGKVRDARVLRSIPLLDQAAIDAVRQWEFTPTLVNGVPVPVVMTVTVNFSMPGSPGPTPVSSSPDMILLGVNQTADGFAGVFQIDRARATALPRWNPETDAPLLSIADVTRLARESVMQRNAGASRFDLENVTLRKSMRPSAPTFWFYTVTFAGQSGDPRQVLSAVILPDGTVVEPSAVQSTVPPR
jgi:TonB family protein